METVRNLYVTSDIHGHFKELFGTLGNMGFSRDNKEDVLVVCGDMFDRGRESLLVYEFLKDLYDRKKAVIIRGNHENMLIDYLDGTCISPFNYLHNGMDETFAEFLHCTKPFESWCAVEDIKNPTYGDFAEWLQGAVSEINEAYPELLPWLKSLPYYFETEHFIFTHGGIDTDVENWKEPRCTKFGKTGWEALVWDDGSFFGKDIKNTDKRVFIGHFGTAHLRQMYNLDTSLDEDAHDTLSRDDFRVVALDSTVVVSKRLNCAWLSYEPFEDDGIWN